VLETGPTRWASRGRENQGNQRAAAFTSRRLWLPGESVPMNIDGNEMFLIGLPIPWAIQAAIADGLKEKKRRLLANQLALQVSVTIERQSLRHSSGSGED